MKQISIVFMSIFFEAVPFLFLGSLVSGIIDIYLNEERVAKIFPKNKILGTLCGVFLGFFVPACDCAVIPISRRLIKKKIPLNITISFMLSSPFVNPIVLLSTYSAFFNNMQFFWIRLIGGITIAIIVSLIMSYIYKTNPLKPKFKVDACNCCTLEELELPNIKNKLDKIIKHAFRDFFDILRYLIIGALITTIVQVLIPKEWLNLFTNKYLSMIFLMLFAFTISLCSTSDSFIAKSLMPIFPKEAIYSYLLLGPMMDIKNLLVLQANYHKKFIWILVSLIFLLVFICSLVVSLL